MMDLRCPWAMMVVLLAAGGCDKGEEKKPGEAGAGGGGGAATPAGGIEVKAVQLVGLGDGTCARMEDGTVRCWGRSDAGELGGGRVATQAASAVVIPGLAGATQLFAGGDAGSAGDVGCVLKEGNKVWCWGANGTLLASKEGAAAEIAELAGTVHVALGGGHGVFAMTDGTVKGYGGNVFNVMGLGETAPDPGRDKWMPIPGVADAVLVAAGQNHSCAVHKDATASCWGYPSRKINATKVEGVADIESIVAQQGGDSTCVITKAKTVTCWGADLKAKPVEGLSDVVALDNRNHTCATKADGTVWCWGDNDRGQLGTGTKERSYKPVQVAGISDAVAAATGQQHTCVLHKDGHASCWGMNANGQLGDGTLMDRTAPVVVQGLNAKTPPPPLDGLAEVQQAATKQSFEGLPEGCTYAPTIEGKFRTFEGSFPVISANAKNEDGKGLTYSVQIANYQQDYGKWEPLRGKQLRLQLRFAKIDLKSKDKTPMPIVPGVYSMDTKQDQLVYPSMADRTFDNIMLGGFSLTEGLKAGEVELTKIGDGWICGELRLQTKDSKFSGTFAAKVAEKK